MDFAGSRYYDLNRIFLSAVGLWPYETTKLSKIQGFFTFVILSSGVTVQLLTFFTTKITLHFLIRNLSYTTVSLGFIVKYITFLHQSNSVKHLLDRIVYDWNTLTNEEELRIINEYSKVTRMLTAIYSFIIYPSLLLVALSIFSNQVLDILIPLNYSRPRVLIFKVEYFVDQQKYFYPIAVHTLTFAIFGSTVLLATETLAMAIMQHVCGLCKIISYRLEHTFVSNIPGVSVAERSFIVHRKVLSLVNLHRRIIQYVHLMRKNFTTSYVILIALGMNALILTIFLFLKALSVMTDMNDLLISLFVAFGITCYAFIGNHFAQDLIDHGSHIYKDAYDTEWYKIPVMEQKLLLFFMQHSLKDLTINLYHLFIPSHKGFSLIIRTCFSYSMVIYSFE